MNAMYAKIPSQNNLYRNVCMMQFLKQSYTLKYERSRASGKYRNILYIHRILDVMKDYWFISHNNNCYGYQKPEKLAKDT